MEGKTDLEQRLKCSNCSIYFLACVYGNMLSLVGLERYDQTLVVMIVSFIKFKQAKYLVPKYRIQ